MAELVWPGGGGGCCWFIASAICWAWTAPRWSQGTISSHRILNFVGSDCDASTGRVWPGLGHLSTLTRYSSSTAYDGCPGTLTTSCIRQLPEVAFWGACVIVT